MSVPPLTDGAPSAAGREQTPGEEIANGLSAGMGLTAAVAAIPTLLVAARGREDSGAIVGAAVFAVTLLLLYLASTLYHILPPGAAKRVFRVLDHQAIFLLIAGTYTPFTLGVLRGPWGWTLLGLIWGAAAAGVTLKAARGVRHPWLSTAIYLGMGWLVLIAIEPLWRRMPLGGLAWLLAGGLAYTGGLAFFAARRMRYSHLVWHLFVLAGTACHFLAVLWYAAG